MTATGWDDGELRCPLGGEALVRDTAHSLAAAGRRWPVLEEIAFLRADRQDLADAALAALDVSRTEEALVLLLGDQDGWARSAPPTEDARRDLVRNAASLTFRDAMDRLAFGPVGTYFAHRWSDPTFLSGLALAEAHGVDGPVFELACGAGHFLREFMRVGLPAVGGDIVFAKLWLARRYVAPAARLVCFDAAATWPFADQSFGTVFCHDAFYFLPRKPHVAAEMRRMAGRVLVGHAHNVLTDNLSAGEPLTPEAYQALFPGAQMYDDRELTAALVASRRPRAEQAAALHGAPALSWAFGAGVARPIQAGVAIPAQGQALRRNPLYVNDRVSWPSPRYESEYGPLATYPIAVAGPERAVFGDGVETDALARRRVLLDLPAAW